MAYNIQCQQKIPAFPGLSLLAFRLKAWAGTWKAQKASRAAHLPKIGTLYLVNRIKAAYFLRLTKRG